MLMNYSEYIGLVVVPHTLRSDITTSKIERRIQYWTPRKRPKEWGPPPPKPAAVFGVLGLLDFGACFRVVVALTFVRLFW